MSGPQRSRRYDVVVSGGGTAGHVAPALAVAEALVDAGHERSAIHFVGSSRGMEARLVPEAGFEVSLLPGRGIKRRLTLENALAVAELATATLRAFALLARRRPSVVVAVAGYASVPCALAARPLGIPVVVVNIDAVPGAANRLVGRFAAASAVALPGTPLPRAVVTGAPVRPEVLAIDRSDSGRAAARAKLGIDPDRFLVLVTGGSLGARSLNEAALGVARLLSLRRDLAIYHVAGARDHDAMAARLAELALSAERGLDYRLVGYEPAMAEVLAACDLVVARAGASTVAELTVVGLAAVLVPLPGAPSDHQRRNAELLEERGAATVLDDAMCTPERLVELITSLAADPARVAAMAAAAANLGRRDAAARVADLVEEVAARGSRRRRLDALVRVLRGRPAARGAS
ncbi:MAG: murG [Acidimicrobiaceae bacterium]|nr:murG [Acidimicrobiaceae bacterium]